MRLLILEIEGEGVGLDLALRAQTAGHAVQYWLPPGPGGKELRFGEGMVERPKDWESLMDGADLVVLTGNSRYTERLEKYFEEGYPIFGANKRSAQLELDREFGQKVLAAHGVRILPYTVVDDLNAAIAHVVSTRRPIVIKPWGGEGDKSLTAVANTPEEAVFMLERWRDAGLQSKLMLQEKVDGVEVGIAGWFSPAAGWLRMVEESWEHKRFMNDDLGQNTGEQGTVIRHVAESLLFDRVLAPLTNYLYSIQYTGDCSVNCMVDADGTPWPLEFTARLGWPDFTIRQELLDGDPIQWMKDLLDGKDSFDPRTDVAVGVVLTHGDYPVSKDPPANWDGFPISGMDELSWPHLHLQHARYGQEPWIDEEGILRHRRAVVTAGNYVMVTTGSGETVSEAAARATSLAFQVKFPSNKMFRTDISRKLEWELPFLQERGYAKGVRY